MARHQEITLRFCRERVRLHADSPEEPGTAILECVEESSDDGEACGDAHVGATLCGPDANRRIVKVDCFPDELTPDLSDRFFGAWPHHHKYGPRFLARTFVDTLPHHRRGLVRYLSQTPDIGHDTAIKLWNRFGAKAIEVVRTNPDLAAEFVVLDEYPGARRVCSREWLYTGISRAQHLCFLVGRRRTANAMLAQEAIRRRKTFLVEQIQGETPDETNPERRPLRGVPGPGCDR